MSFRITPDVVFNSLSTVTRLKVPIVNVLPVATVGGQFIGVTTATGVDLFYYDGNTWFKIVNSAASGGGLPNVLATNNNSGAVNNIILDNAAGTGTGALTSDAGDDLNLFAGAINTSAPSAGTEDLRLASGTGAGAMVNIDGGLGGVDIDTTGPLTSDSTIFSIDGSSAAAGSNITHVGGTGFDLGISCTAGSLNLVGGETGVLDAVTIDASGAGSSLQLRTGGTNALSIDSFQDVQVPNGTFLVNRPIGIEAEILIQSGDNTAARFLTFSAADTSNGWEIRGPAASDNLIIRGNPGGAFTDTVVQINHAVNASQGVFNTQAIGTGLNNETISTNSAATPEIGLTLGDDTTGVLTITLANGFQVGQIKTFIKIAGLNRTFVVPITTTGLWFSLELIAVGDSFTLMWLTTGWTIIGVGPGTSGTPVWANATGPDVN